VTGPRHVGHADLLRERIDGRVASRSSAGFALTADAAHRAVRIAAWLAAEQVPFALEAVRGKERSYLGQASARMAAR